MKKIQVFILTIFFLSPGSYSAIQYTSRPAPKNIIFMIGDGMGFGQIQMAEAISQKKLFLKTLPNTGVVETSSLNNLVTDSAAAATALATGFKTNNHVVSQDIHGKDLTSILEVYKKKGMKVGLVTTTEITDATPAAFAAHVSNRKQHENIAKWFLKNNVDLLLGGGKRYFENELNNYKTHGYGVMTHAKELSVLTNKLPKKLLGLFHDDFLDFEIDREEVSNSNEEPTLSQMTEFSLDYMKSAPQGFFLMIEGGKIDHGCHHLDMATMTLELLEFDRAVKLAHEFSKNRSDTLLIITADHETAGVGPSEATDYSYLRSQQVSARFIAQQLKQKLTDEGQISEDGIYEMLQTHAHFKLSETDVTFLKKTAQKANEKELSAVIGSIIARHAKVSSLTLDMLRAGDTHGHTAIPVPVYSFGPQSDVFRGTMDNTDIPKKLLRVTRAQSNTF